MSNYINPVVINPVTMKPILFTTYETVTKYNLTITYEDSTTKTVELVQGDKNRPYTVTFKKDGKLVTATGVPTVREISECSKFCDFVNRTMDSNDLLIELDCSSEYECTKVSFYLKDIRDIIDINNESDEGTSEDLQVDNHSKYPIYLNGFPCTTKIYCEVDPTYTISLDSLITKLGESLDVTEYDGPIIMISTSSYIRQTSTIKKKDNDGNDKIMLLLDDRYEFNEELKIIVGYSVYGVDHPIIDIFTIIPYKKGEEIDTGTTLNRAVSTQDMQYLGDGLLPALGTGLTPSYKEYRNRKNAPTSVMMDE